MQFSDLDLDKTYTYADYLKWTFDERLELIKGKIFSMSPAPGTNHQRISGAVFYSLYHSLKGKPCKVFSAPFDVRLTRKSLKNKEITTVIQPDLCVICDLKKIDKKGCIGAPKSLLKYSRQGIIKWNFKINSMLIRKQVF